MRTKPAVTNLLTLIACACASESSTVTPLPPAIPPAECAPIHTVVDQQGLIPDDMEISPDGTELWVASTNRSAVLRFDAVSGRPLDPPLIEEIPFPWALAWGPPDSPSLWVAETTAGKLHRIEPASRERTATAEGFSLPMDIAFDREGRMLLCETKGNVIAFRSGSIQRFDPIPVNGSHKTTLMEEMDGVCDIAPAPDGSLYVVVSRSKDLTRLRANGKVDTWLGLVNAPTDIVYHPQSGGLLVSQMKEVIWIHPEGTTSARVVCEGVNQAEDLAVAADGTVYLSDSLGAKIVRFSIGAGGGGRMTRPKYHTSTL